MKSTGIVRKVDELGRIVIPKELRRKFGIDTKDGLEIYVEEDKIILKKLNEFMRIMIKSFIWMQNRKKKFKNDINF